MAFPFFFLFLRGTFFLGHHAMCAVCKLPANSMSLLSRKWTVLLCVFVNDWCLHSYFNTCTYTSSMPGHMHIQHLSEALPMVCINRSSADSRWRQQSATRIGIRNQNQLSIHGCFSLPFPPPSPPLLCYRRICRTFLLNSSKYCRNQIQGALGHGRVITHTSWWEVSERRRNVEH